MHGLLAGIVHFFLFNDVFFVKKFLKRLLEIAGEFRIDRQITMVTLIVVEHRAIIFIVMVLSKRPSFFKDGLSKRLSRPISFNAKSGWLWNQA